MRLGAGIGQTVRKIQSRGMASLAKPLKTGDSGDADGACDLDFHDPGLFKKSTELGRGRPRGKIQPAAQNDTGLQTNDRRRYAMISRLDRVNETIPVGLVR